VPRSPIAAFLTTLALLVPAAACAGLPRTPSAAAPSRPTLRWPPPHLTNPITINVSSRGGVISLNPRQDYILHVGHVRHKGGLVISGGHNVVLIGGEITIPYVGKHVKKGGGDRRALEIVGATGTVHVEGLLMDGPDLSEGIQISAPKATVQLENVRIVDIHARDEVHFSDNHPDLVQPWGGVRSLRIDRLTGSSDCQGLFLVSSLGRVRYVSLRHIDIAGTRTSGFLLWIDGPKVTFTDVWIRPARGRALKNAIWPVGSRPSRLIHSGVPPAGHFVPASVAGVGYSSPGYVR
jgi:hypothetical protein